MSGLSNAHYLQVDPAPLPDRDLIRLTLDVHIVAGDIAARDVDVLRAHVDVIEQVLAHEPLIAVDAIRHHRVVLVEGECHDVGEVEAFVTVHLDQLAIDPDRRAAGGESKHGVPAFTAPFLDDLGDASGDGAGDLIVLDDDYGDSFLGSWHSVSRRNKLPIK